MSIGICYKLLLLLVLFLIARFVSSVWSVCLLGELIMSLVLSIQIFPYVFLAHKSVTSTTVEHNEVKIRTKAASTKSAA